MLRSSGWTISCETTSPASVISRRLAARLVAQRRLVGGAQLIARTRCVPVGTQDAEMELTQFVDHRRLELGASVAKQLGADP